MDARKSIGLVLGPLLFVAVLASPLLGENPAARKVLAVFALVAVWWVTEALPIPITALLIPVLFTALRVAGAEEAFAPLANPIIFLFLGSFILARAMSLHGLDRRLALGLISRKRVGRNPSRLLLAFGVVSAGLSLWLSNTATTAMMFPIALGVLSAFPPEKEGEKGRSFFVTLLLMTAYGASVGGIGTPVGSPPNLITIAMLDKLAGVRISFFHWMILAALVAVPMMAVLYFYLKFRTGKHLPSAPPAVRAASAEKLGPLTRAEKNVLVAFSLTVTLWVLPGFLSIAFGPDCRAAGWLQKTVPESSAALLGAGLLFLLPVNLKEGRFTCSLGEALQIDWGTLLLFGGGLSLGTQMFHSGLAEAIGVSFLGMGGRAVSAPLLTLLTVSFSVFLTEVVSNTAAANMVIPVVIAVCRASGLDPAAPAIGAGLACSFAFMMPVATPPNAIIYGSGRIPLSSMIRAGLVLNLFGIAIIWTGVCVLAPLLGLL
ncbi:MAG: DASS family sodium-coupled anion symporter [Candidatus Aminicenantes bacterium]|nr:DASS family sodium-coupled anion symporter [Candidatus Aminicenantes bacterium]